MSVVTMRAPRRLIGPDHETAAAVAPRKFTMRIVYEGAHDSRILDEGVRNRRAHVWFDTVPMPQLGDSFVPGGAPEGEAMWTEAHMQGSKQLTLDVTAPPDAKYAYVAVFDNRLADVEGDYRTQVVVQGERRCQAALNLSPIFDGKTIEVKLDLPELDPQPDLGHVVAWRDTEGTYVTYNSRDMDRAHELGKALAARNTALPGVPSLTLGMLDLDTKMWNSKRTGLPGWVLTLNMPRQTETSEFVYGILCAAAQLRGISKTDMETLASNASQSIAKGGSTPSAATVTFAMLVAEAVFTAVTRAHYLTDAFDANAPGSRWRESKLNPVECMTANIREDGGDDCEGFAAGMASLMYGIAKGPEPSHAVHAAARAICRCWVPMVTLGQATRSGGEGDQYDLGDGTNAHSWAIFMPTSAVKLMAKQHSTCEQSVCLDDTMLDPWTEGLPVLLVDGTGKGELYPRYWTQPVSPESRKGTLAEWLSRLGFVKVMHPMDPGFHQICRSAYTPYGLVSSTDNRKRAFEVYWYSFITAQTVVNHFDTVVRPAYQRENTKLTIEDVAPYALQAYDAMSELRRGESAKDMFYNEWCKMAPIACENHRRDVKGVYLRYGAPTADLFRLPHAKPSGFGTEAPPLNNKHGTGHKTPWLAATMCVSEEELQVLRVAAAEMHPVRCAPPALKGDSKLLSLAVAEMCPIKDQELRNAADPWAAPPRAMTILYAHAKDLDNIQHIMGILRKHFPSKRLHVGTLCFWGGEPQLWIVDDASS